MIGRLDPQKGFDLLAGRGAGVAGAGRPPDRARLRASVARGPVPGARHGPPGPSRVPGGFDRAMARRIYAGADLFPMPTRSSRAGRGSSSPFATARRRFVHRTGGLADTVVDQSRIRARGPASSSTSRRLTGCSSGMRTGVGAPHGRGQPGRGPDRGMAVDFDWATGSAPLYVAAYQRAVAIPAGRRRRRGRPPGAERAFERLDGLVEMGALWCVRGAPDRHHVSEPNRAANAAEAQSSARPPAAGSPRTTQTGVRRWPDRQGRTARHPSRRSPGRPTARKDIDLHHRPARPRTSPSCHAGFWRRSRRAITPGLVGARSPVVGHPPMTLTGSPAGRAARASPGAGPRRATRPTTIAPRRARSPAGPRSSRRRLHEGDQSGRRVAESMAAGQWPVRPWPGRSTATTCRPVAANSGPTRHQFAATRSRRGRATADDRRSPQESAANGIPAALIVVALRRVIDGAAAPAGTLDSGPDRRIPRAGGGDTAAPPTPAAGGSHGQPVRGPLKNEPGAMATLAEALAARGVDLRAIGGGSMATRHVIMTTADDETTKAILDDHGYTHRGRAAPHRGPRSPRRHGPPLARARGRGREHLWPPFLAGGATAPCSRSSSTSRTSPARSSSARADVRSLGRAPGR